MIIAGSIVILSDAKDLMPFPSDKVMPVAGGDEILRFAEDDMNLRP
jgi:hypothetical protein